MISTLQSIGPGDRVGGSGGFVNDAVEASWSRGSRGAVYGPERYERLAAIKKTYDPANMFRINHDVVPAA